MTKENKDKKTETALSQSAVEGLVSHEDLDNLKHMTGCDPKYKKRQWGFRNHYCASKSGKDQESMQRLLSVGYVVQGVEQERSIFFHATEAGCKAIGMKPAQIKNALNG